MPELMTLPLSDIDRDAFPRDRTFQADTAFDELCLSILQDGLRQPVEVCAVEGETPFALISGYRRLAAVSKLNENGIPGFDTIKAFLLRPENAAAGFAMMIAENDIRSDLSAWDRGRILVDSVDHGYFDSLDGAIRVLHPAADRAKQARLRSLAQVVQTFDGLLSEPHCYSQAKLLRLAASCREGFGDLMTDALGDVSSRNPASQWDLLGRIMAEAELAHRDPVRLADDTRPGYPRRRMRVRATLVIRREFAPDGWTLRFTGREATGRLMQEIMDHIDLNFGRD